MWLTPLHHTKRAFFDQVPGKAPNRNAPLKKARHLLLKGCEKLRKDQRLRLDDILEEYPILSIGYKLSFYPRLKCLPFALTLRVREFLEIPPHDRLPAKPSLCVPWFGYLMTIANGAFPSTSFQAALCSGSWCALHCGRTHSRICSGYTSFCQLSQYEQTRYKVLTTRINVQPSHFALYSSIMSKRPT